MRQTGLSSDHLLAIDDLSVDDIELIFHNASEFLEVLNRPIKKVPTLRDLTIANVFFESSTRTRISFELAEKRLGADVVNFSSAGSSVSKGETLVDTVRNLIAMKVDMVVLRHPSPGAAHFLSTQIRASVINAGDGTHEHPTQALLDAFTLRRRFGTLKGLKVLLLGDILHSRVARSAIHCLGKLGAEVMVCGPLPLIPRDIEKWGVLVEPNLDNALKWCDVAYVLRIQLERQAGGIPFFPSLREYSMNYGLNSARVRAAGREMVIMHPGPVNRGVEISGELADSGQSIIMDQVENGVAIRMAVLYLLSLKISRF